MRQIRITQYSCNKQAIIFLKVLSNLVLHILVDDISLEFSHAFLEFWIERRSNVSEILRRLTSFLWIDSGKKQIELISWSK